MGQTAAPACWVMGGYQPAGWTSAGSHVYMTLARMDMTLPNANPAHATVRPPAITGVDGSAGTASATTAGATAVAGAGAGGGSAVSVLPFLPLPFLRLPLPLPVVPMARRRGVAVAVSAAAGSGGAGTVSAAG